METTSKRKKTAKIINIKHCFKCTKILFYSYLLSRHQFAFSFSLGIHFHQHETPQKIFPCFTIRTLDPYKKRGFFFTTRDYIQQSYSPSDIFKEKTISTFKNSSLFLNKEVHTLLHGNIIVICPNEKVTLKERFFISLKKGRAYEIFFFPRGEELWFGMARFPTDISSIIIETATMHSADLAISEIETKQFSKKRSPCKTYQSTSSSELGFANCGREAIASFLKSNINCTIPGLSMFLSSPDVLPECKDKVSAKESYDQFVWHFMYCISF
jgi:hypothetical protein